MKYDDVVEAIGTITDLRRIASAHVVDYRNLEENEIRAALVKVRGQYLDADNIERAANEAMCEHESLKHRVLSKLILTDVMLAAHGYVLPKRETGERLIAFEQMVIDRANEMDVSSLAWGKRDSERYKHLELYNFVLGVAWAHQDTKSIDEANLLRKLRKRLHINEWTHRLLEAKLGKYPKADNEVHTQREIDETRRLLQCKGILFAVRDNDGDDFDAIPEEIGDKLRGILDIEMRPKNYIEMLHQKFIRSKSYMRSALEAVGLGYSPGERLDELIERVTRNIRPSRLLIGPGPLGLQKERLRDWCSSLGLAVSGSKQELSHRIIAHYDNLRLIPTTADERIRFYDLFETLAARDYNALRSAGIITKEINTEARFEDATTYLFETKLRHSPLKQPGVNRPDGLLSFRNMYLMWDCKTKEPPGEVHLKDHLRQFHDYMEKSDRPVPIFMVIAPGFTQQSEAVALQYSAEQINRNILLITAQELKELAEEWSSQKNKRRDEPFPLGLFNRTGRFRRELLGKFI
ncbi:hypothetical protein J7M28_04185 [bacterium]|nr:hypothetical protein [bacterium]